METLITALVKQNEINGDMKLTVAAPRDKKSELEASFFKKTHFIYVPTAKSIKRLIHKCIQFAWDKLGLNHSVPLNTPFQREAAKLVNPEEYDIIVMEGGMFEPTALYRKRYGDKLWYHLHGVPEAPFKCLGYKTVISVSEFAKKSWLQYCDEDTTHSVSVVHNGIDVAKFQREFTEEDRKAVRAQLGFAPDDFVALYCGRIIEVKGVLELLKAIQRIDDDHVKLMVVGSPDFAKSSRTPYLDKVQSLVDELGDRVAFTGYVPNDQVYQYSKSADVQVVPSLWEEAAGLVGVEAMAAGLPLIVSHSGGLQEYVPETCSIVVERNESFISSLSDAIVSLREHPELCESMMKNGLLQAEQFSEQTFYDEFVRAIGE
ncbi:glycosyltransferase family 4 protein [Bifidobacterium boum]|uniref:glycosyltransferase family 4 protein n=1 Tax=Bifidobacterium boum TaxID=78343 RepID=UPI001F2FFC8A|nr:glycosyltransferase family 4 protein [Bifidobacterium boum]MCF2561215.1 glycosyltransferase family 4 protein [Bifidobacterium boum]